MKDAYYFSHDANARHDQRIISIRRKYGMEGYGIYFGIIETLRETSNYMLSIDEEESLLNIAYDLNVDIKKIKDIVFNYDLFEIKEEFFYSRSLSRRMEKLDKIKEKRRESGRLGGKVKASAKQVLKENKAFAKQVKESKVKEIKVNKNKKDIIKEKTEAFKNQVFEFKTKYDLDMLKAFIDYWSEPNKSMTKLLYELQKTWDIERRLSRWARNNNTFDSKQSPSQKYKQNGSLDEEISARNSKIAKQSKRFRRYIKEAKKSAATPSEIGQIIGKTIEKLKSKSGESEENG